jgi:H+/Cl- antiporter ClcA
MTGGACAGFAVATGASVSGILFALEEAHQKISPMILIVSSIAVLVAQLCSLILCPLLNLSTSIFPNMAITTLAVKDVWIPLLVGVSIGLFAVVFLKYYHIVNKFFNSKLKKIPHHVKIFLVYALTLVFGLVSFSFISTGHEIFPLLLEGKVAVLGLVALLLVRMSLTLFANTNKLTGGVFIPIMALGAIMASIVGRGLQSAFGLDQSYQTIILALGVAGCIASMMKMPLTAVIFSLEALGCGNNVIHVIIVVAVSFIITELFGVKGINDGIIDNIVKSQEETHKRLVIDTHITIQKGSFAEFRHVKDIIWPSNFFLLSIIPSKSRKAFIDQEGSMTLHEGDVLHIRYATFDEEHTKQELIEIVGEQDYDETETTNE